MKSLITNRTNELIKMLSVFEDYCSKDLYQIGMKINSVFQNGGKILICGNGGSAADSQHLAAEFVNAFSRSIERRALPAISLSTDSSVITSIANDFSFENIFSRQVEALGQREDALIVISTSGSSMNCIKAIEAAKRIGMSTISLTSKNGAIADSTDLSLKIPSSNTQIIQAGHLHAYHLITEIVESTMFGEK
jgi:D-sedoheptulose 7-phosphate isomerase